TEAKLVGPSKSIQALAAWAGAADRARADSAARDISKGEAARFMVVLRWGSGVASRVRTRRIGPARRDASPGSLESDQGSRVTDVSFHGFPASLVSGDAIPGVATALSRLGQAAFLRCA